MTETNFTPGPWKIENKYAWYGSSDADDQMAILSDMGVIFWCGNSRSYYPTEGVEPNQANAHLIAAAPDLYEALEKANLELKQLHHDLFHTLYKNDEIEKSLKKARGETE